MEVIIGSEKAAMQPQPVHLAFGVEAWYSCFFSKPIIELNYPEAFVIGSLHIVLVFCMIFYVDTLYRMVGARPIVPKRWEPLFYVMTGTVSYFSATVFWNWCNLVTFMMWRMVTEPIFMYFVSRSTLTDAYTLLLLCFFFLYCFGLSALWTYVSVNQFFQNHRPIRLTFTKALDTSLAMFMMSTPINLSNRAWDVAGNYSELAHWNVVLHNLLYPFMFPVVVLTASYDFSLKLSKAIVENIPFQLQVFFVMLFQVLPEVVWIIVLRFLSHSLRLCPRFARFGWALTRRAWNKLMHMLRGNIDRLFTKEGRPILDVPKEDKKTRLLDVYTNGVYDALGLRLAMTANADNGRLAEVMVQAAEVYPMFLIQREYRALNRQLDGKQRMSLTDKAVDKARLKHQKDLMSQVERKFGGKTRDLLKDVRGPVRESFKGTVQSNFWKVPLEAKYCRVGILRPTLATWTPLLGKQWLTTEAFRLRKEAPRNYAVIGNEAARLLYKITDSSPNPKVLIQLLANATVYFHNMNSLSTSAPRNVELFDYVDPTGQRFRQPLTFRGELIERVDQVMDLKIVMKRHRPLWSLMLAYVQGQEVDVGRLQQALNQHFPFQSVPQSGGLDPIFTDEELVDVLDLTQDVEEFDFTEVAQELEVEGELQSNLVETQNSFAVESDLSEFSLGSLPFGTFEDIDRCVDAVPNHVALQINLTHSDFAKRTPDEIVFTTSQLIYSHAQQLFLCCFNRQAGEDKEVTHLKHFLDFLTKNSFALDVSRWAACWISLYDCQTLRSAVAIVYNFVTGFPVLRDIFSDMINSCVSEFGVAVDQAFEFEFFRISWKSLRNCAVGRALADLLASMSIYQLLSQLPGFKASWLSGIVQRLLSLANPKLGGDTLLGKLANVMVVLFERIQECMKQESWLPLLGEGDNPEVWMHAALALTTYSTDLVTHDVISIEQSRRLKELRDKGLIPASWVEPFSPNEFKDRVDQYYIQGKSILKSVGSNVLLYREVLNVHGKLHSFQESISASSNIMSPRPQPFGLLVFGKASVGKTNFKSTCIKSIARRRGYSYDANCIYSWMANSNFQEGLNENHWTIVQDDGDQDPSPPLRGQSNHVQTVLTVCDNKPLPVEQPKVDLKGKVAARPLFFMHLTNFENCRLAGYSLFPQAFWRRLPLRVEVIVKPEFANNGSIDKDKVLESEDGDIHILRVSVFDNALYDSDNPFGPPPYRFVKDMSRSEFLVYMGKMYDDHIAEQLEAMRRCAMGTDFCSICGIDFTPLNRCDCVMVGREQSRLPLYCTVGVVGAFFTRRFLKSAVVRVNKWYDEKLIQLRTTVRAAIREGATDAATLVKDDLRLNIWKMSAHVSVAIGSLLTATLILAKAYSYVTTTSTLQARENNSSDIVPTNFKRMDQTYTPGVPVEIKATYTYDEMVAAMRQSYVAVKNFRMDKGVVGVQISHDTVLTVYHILGVTDPEDFSVPLEIVQQGIVIQMVATPLNTTQLGLGDKCLIRVSALVARPTVLTKFWTNLDHSVRQFDGYVVVHTDGSLVTEGVAKLTNIENQPVVKVPHFSKGGDCGLLYAAKMNSGWKVVGIHFRELKFENMFGVTVGLESAATVVTRTEIESALIRVQSTPQAGVIPANQTCLVPSQQSYGYMPVESELLTAMTHHGVQAYCLGTAQVKVHGSTMKSRCYPTLFAEEFRHFERLYCGMVGYWCIPSFKGRMEDGKWVSPYTHMLTHLDRKNWEFSDDHMALAFLDYVHRFASLNYEGFRPLSDQEAMRGVPGSVIGGVDMQTSIGMPFNQKKSPFFKVIDGEVYTHDKFSTVYEEFRDAYTEYQFPLPVGLVTLKDEQIKFSKLLKCDVRTFVCLIFGLNLCGKKYFSPTQAFMRANPYEFESMVGINMMSPEATGLVRFFQTVDPKLERVEEGDFVKFDKAINGPIYHWVALTAVAVAWLIGTDYMWNYSLIHSCKNTVYVIKNDFFQLGALNPSGGFATVEVNSWANSKIHRYVYFRQKFPTIPKDLLYEVRQVMRQFMVFPGIVFNLGERLKRELDFRVHHALATYGDDYGKAMSQALKYDGAKVPDLCAELGMKITGADKTSNVAVVPFDKFQFLKRRFVFDEELQQYLTPLDLKSIVKMLVLAKGSVLTQRDHASVLLNDALRELVYHGRDVFEEFRGEIARVAKQYELQDNPYLQIKTYEEYRREIAAGSFKTWSFVKNDDNERIGEDHR